MMVFDAQPTGDFCFSKSSLWCTFFYLSPIGDGDTPLLPADWSNEPCQRCWQLRITFTSKNQPKEPKKIQEMSWQESILGRSNSLSSTMNHWHLKTIWLVWSVKDTEPSWIITVNDGGQLETDEPPITKHCCSSLEVLRRCWIWPSSSWAVVWCSPSFWRRGAAVCCHQASVLQASLVGDLRKKLEQGVQRWFMCMYIIV